MDYHPASEAVTPVGRPLRLLDQVRAACRVRHYSLRTERAYVGWARRFILANGKRHPPGHGRRRGHGLPDPAGHSGAGGSQYPEPGALGALVSVSPGIGHRPSLLEGIVRAKRPARVPVVLTREEITRLLAALEGQDWDMGALMYGAGLRLMECVRLRIKDVDFARREIVIRRGKGGKDPRSGELRRHHIDEAVIQRTVRTARLRAGIVKPATCHTLRHSFATHVLGRGASAVTSPLDLP